MKLLVLAGVLLAGCVGFSSAASADTYGLRRTCPQVWENWPYITATCYNAFGGLQRSRIDARRCGGGMVTNVNGQLACSGGGGYRPRPPGWGGGYGGGGGPGYGGGWR